jgi:hypothetical protein
MRSLIAGIALLTAAWNPAYAQSARKIQIALDGHSEGRPSREGAGAQLFDEVRRGLERIGDLEMVPLDRANRIVWIVTGAAGGPYAASLMITERYDRETLMVLGIEDDDTAARMMSLQIVNEHQIFTGSDLADVARRIVASIDTGVLARLRAVPKR